MRPSSTPRSPSSLASAPRVAAASLALASLLAARAASAQGDAPAAPAPAPETPPAAAPDAPPGQGADAGAPQTAPAPVDPPRVDPPVAPEGVAGAGAPADAATPLDPAPEDPTPAIPPPPATAATPNDEVVVAGTRVSHTAGSLHVLDKQHLERFEYDDAHAMLGHVPGVYARGEDGMGLRPNLGIRGANPNRSAKLTLMEDGILFGPAPYAAPAAYYFPLLTRMTQVRVIKGPAAIAFGPQTVGGAVDFLSRPVPTKTVASIDLAAGDYGYGKGHAYFGSGNEQMGFLVEGVRLQTTGFGQLPSGADTGSTRNDWMAKGAYTLDPDAVVKHRFQAKLSYADEVSNETYLGQSDADFRTNPYRRYAASSLDQMKNHRAGVVLSHTMDATSSTTPVQLKTSVYRFEYQRTWKKLNRLGGASVSDVLKDPDDPSYGGYYRVVTGQIDSSGGPADRLYVGPNDRTFVSQGVQSVLTSSARTGPLEHQLETGLRFHHDRIRRVHTEDAYFMIGGELVPAPDQATIVTTRNIASAHALALHATDAITWKRLTLTPGARFEVIAFDTVDQLGNVRTNQVVPAAMPGVGAFYEVVDHLGVLAGVHRGFSPPAPGGASSVKPEYSVNYEAGARYTRGALRAEIIGFFNDYSNLTDVCTLSSGCVDQSLDRQFDAGKAQVLGLEAFASHVPRVGPVRIPFTVAYTLTRGTFRSDFQSTDPIYGVVSKGDELPYIPRHQFNTTLAVEHQKAGLNASVSYVAPMREQAGSLPIEQSVATDEQLWADFGGYLSPLRWLKIYGNLRNAFGGEFIVGRRPYGARVNAPQWLQVGVKATY